MKRERAVIFVMLYASCGLAAAFGGNGGAAYAIIVGFVGTLTLLAGPGR